MEFFTANTGWLLLAYTLGTGIGWYFASKASTKNLAEDIIDRLIEHKFLKTKGYGDELEIIKHTEWCDDKATK